MLLYGDDHYLIINKPPIISSLEDRTDPVTIIGLARQHDPGAQLCHRLDKETSGVMVIARDPEAYRHMSIQLERRKVEKVYHALVDGLHDFREKTIDLPITVSGSGAVRVDRKEGKQAITVVNTLLVYRKHSLVSCRLITGRMHQIRVHLSSMDAPVTGDALYGGQPFYLSSIKRGYQTGRGREEKPLIQRVALHARSIRFQFPDGQKHTFEAPYPKDFKALLNQLDKNA